LLQQCALDDRISPNDYDYALLQGWLKDPLGGAWDMRGAGSVNLAPAEMGGRAINDLVMVAGQSARGDPYLRWGNQSLRLLLRLIPCWKPKVALT
jgi:hypothetical protein